MKSASFIRVPRFAVGDRVEVDGSYRGAITEIFPPSSESSYPRYGVHVSMHSHFPQIIVEEPDLKLVDVDEESLSLLALSVKDSFRQTEHFWDRIIEDPVSLDALCTSVGHARDVALLEAVSLQAWIDIRLGSDKRTTRESWSDSVNQALSGYEVLRAEWEERDGE